FGDRRQVEFVGPQHRDAGPAGALAAGRDRGRPETVAAREHLDRRLVEPEVVDRMRARAVLDEEHAVAGEPGRQDGLRVERAQVPERRVRHAPLDVVDQTAAARRAPLEPPPRAPAAPAATTAEPADAAGRLLALLLGPEPAVDQAGDRALVDPARRLEREA